MSQHLLIDFDTEQNNKEDPETLLKSLIAQQSAGHYTTDTIHGVIRSVMGRDDNKMKRLLYYFFETMKKDDNSLIICQSQMKKDLQSPNEYVRGIALKFISTLDNQDIVHNLWKDVQENLHNRCSFVRMNALHCMGELGLRFDLEVEPDVQAMMKRESSSQVLAVGFDVMHKLGMSFDEFLEIEYPKEILEILVKSVDEGEFLKRVANSKHPTVAFAATCKLLAMGIRTEACVDSIVRLIETTPDLKQDFLPYLRFVRTHSMEILGMIDPYDYEFSAQAIDTVFKNADTSEFMKIAEFLYHEYNDMNVNSEKKRVLRMLLLKKMSVFATTHCVFVEGLVDDSIANLTAEDPELVYGSLEFLHTCARRERLRGRIHKELIGRFSGLKYGRIVRRVFDVLAEDVEREDYERLLDRLQQDMRMEDEVPFYLSKESEVFVGAHVAVCLAEAHRKEWGMKEKVIGTLLRLIEVGTEQKIMDVSSKQTITACVRAVLKDVQQRKSEEKMGIEFRPIDVLEPVEFSLLTAPVLFKQFEEDETAQKSQSTVQLSGLGDPLYIEAGCVHTRYEVLLDILVINQTTSYLQDISIDFNYSRNIQMIFPVDPFALQPNSATTHVAKFSIQDSLASFITATVTFKYPKKDDYSGKPFVLNCSDIVFDINEFLLPAVVDFRDHWKNLEWENLYSVSLRRDFTDVLDKICRAVNGHVCDRFSAMEFETGNIACYTIQRTLILVNVCVSAGATSTVELRVRSKNEELVRNVSGLLSHYLKGLQ